MTTKKPKSQATNREGVNFVRALVESNNSTFQEINLENDLGNDAYIEFVVEEYATGCCVALQIKSGVSYRTAQGKYTFQSNRDHFEYWSSHTLPVLAVIYDPEKQTAFWTDITKFLREHPSFITDGPYTIPADREFTNASFSEFREHCLRYRDQYEQEQSFGRALESFSALEDTERCYDGLKALFAYHRQRIAMWYYLISCISNYKQHPILRALIYRLCYIPGHGDIFWSKQNVINEQVRSTTLLFMRFRFDHRDALTMLSAIDDAGVDRGTIGQSVFALVDLIPEGHVIMESIAVDKSQTERVRHSAILFAASAARKQSVECALDVLARIRLAFDDEDLLGTISWLEEDLKQYGRVSIY